MKNSQIVFSLVATVCLFGHAAGNRPVVKTGPDRNATSLNVGLKRVGTLKTRTASEIGLSNWTIDGGPVDRDFTDFDKYCDYLPALGAAKIRVLTGWAKCEKTPGVIDVAWLDHIVDWCAAHGIATILELSYGNPIYPGAGGAGLSDGIPNTSEGLAMWDRWVEFLAGHFNGRVDEWAMWNEPDNISSNTPEMIAAFNVRSARILRRFMPSCRIHALSLGRNDPEFLEDCLKHMGGDVGLFDTFIYHGYVKNPDYSYPIVEAQQKVLTKYAPHARLRQGENGCASEWLDRFALNWHPWSETSQAKWDMRRALGDLGHDVESGLFCIVDINYGPPTYWCAFSNRKGYLRTNASNDVIAVKRAFYAMQNVISVFDSRLKRVKDAHVTTADRTLALYEYRRDGDADLFVFWSRGPMRIVPVAEGRLTADQIASSEVLDEDAAPGDSFETREAVFEWKGVPLENPVWCDLMTGWVYEIPEENQIIHADGVTLVRVPAYDSPCIVAERRALDFE